MRVFIPPPLRSYTGGRARVEVEGATLGAVLDALDGLYPGLRFRIVDEQDRIRPHIRFVVREEFAPTLAHPLEPGDEVQIICALSGGSPGHRIRCPALRAFHVAELIRRWYAIYT